MVYRIYVEKLKAYAHEAGSLLHEANHLLNITGLKDVRILNRYDVEGITEDLFARAVQHVFSEPQVDQTYGEIEAGDGIVFAVEYLPGQFDQRADSAAQCIQFISAGERPTIRSAKVYILQGDLSENDIAAIKKYVINPVEAREAALDKPETLQMVYDVPETVAILTGFRDMDGDSLNRFIGDNGLAKDVDDLVFCRDHFREIDRDPTITEIKVIDTYWSDHCRHTTFHTIIDDVQFEDALLQ